MTTTRDRRDDPPRDRPPTVRIGDAGDLAAALPRLLGYRPEESVVLLALGGESGRRLGMTMRADIPPPALAPELARSWAGLLAAQGPAAVAAVVVSDAPDDGVPPAPPPAWPGAADDDADAELLLDGREPDVDLPHRLLLWEVHEALAGVGLPLAVAVLVRGERWWDYDCPEACCAPGAGTRLPPESLELAAASVLSGQVVEPSRAALAGRIRRSAELTEAHTRTWTEVGAAVVRETALDGPGPVAERSWTALLDALARLRPGDARGRLDEAELARVVYGLVDEDVRDRAMGLAVGPDAVAAEALWTECTRRSPAPLDAAPATLLAVSAWLRGDGTTANVALDRALDSRPGATLPRLLRSALGAALPPAELRALVARLAEDPGPGGSRAGSPAAEDR